MRNWDTLLESYINVLSQRGLSKAYVSNVEKDLTSLGNFLRNVRPKVSLENVNSYHLLNFIQKRTSFKSKATTSGTISKVRCFGEHLVSKGVWTSNPIRWVQGPKLNNHRAISKSLNKEHIGKIYVECFKVPGTYSKFITPAIFSLLYSTGMRKGELIGLNIDCWNDKEKSIKITSTKTGTERIIPVQDLTANLIETYLSQRTQVLFKTKLEEEKALFITSSGQRLTGCTLHAKFKRLAEKAEIPMFSLHMLRHSCATDLIAAGVGIPQVQRILGHACMQSTFRYTHVSDPQRTEAIQKHPINEILGAI